MHNEILGKSKSVKLRKYLRDKFVIEQLPKRKSLAQVSVIKKKRKPKENDKYITMGPDPSGSPEVKTFYKLTSTQMAALLSFIISSPLQKA